MSGPLSPSCWMSVVRLTDIFLGEGERVGVGEGVGWRTQEWLWEKREIKGFDSFQPQRAARF